MKKFGKEFLLAFLLVCLAAPAAWPAPQSPGQPRQRTQAREGVIVGRLSLAEGEILRYVPEQKDWVITVKDSPFGLEDAIYSGENSRAEFLIPNGTWVRIGANTQVQVVALKGDASEIDVASGMARFIGRNDRTMLKATTPFGYALGEPGSAFDVYVGDQSVEVIALRGNVNFVHDVDGTRYDLTPGAMSILADNKQTTAGDGKVDSEWDDWNISRDTVLVQSIRTKGESVKYLPEGIREDAGVFDENGRWEQVYYEGQYRQVWRPTYVDSGWAPYTVGRWTDWYGDYTWVPYEPWGYTTSHYGYWFSANNYWYWAPPVVSIGFGVPYWGIGFSWYPGRVGWLYSDVSIGWFPLLPWEPYYAHRWWGPWGFPWRGHHHYHHDYARFHNYDHARVIRQADFTRDNYAGRVTPVDGAALRNPLRPTPVLDKQALANVSNPRDRFNFTNRTPTMRPDPTVTARVDRNAARFSQVSDRVNGRTIQQQASMARPGRPTPGAQVAAPGIAAGGTTGGERALVRNPRTVQPSSAPQLGAVQRGSGAGVSARPGRNQAMQSPGSAAPRSQQFSTGRQQTSRSPAALSGSGRPARDTDISGRSALSPRSGVRPAPDVSRQSRPASPSGRQSFQGRSASPSYQSRPGSGGFSGGARGPSMQSAPRSGYSGPRSGGQMMSAPRGGYGGGAPRSAPMMSAPRGGGGGGAPMMSAPRGGDGGGLGGGGGHPGGGGFGGGGRR